MSVLHRPDGDDIAAYVSSSFNLSYIDPHSIDFHPKPSEKYDVLCGDGLNYVIDVRSYEKAKDHGHFHFMRWPRKSDYKGSFQDLYLAPEGRFSKLQGISGLNYYHKLIVEESKEAVKTHSQKLKSKPSSSSAASASSNHNHSSSSASSDAATVISNNSINIGKGNQPRRNSMPSVERYPDDFLSKPRAVMNVDNIYIDDIDSRPSTRALARALHVNNTHDTIIAETSSSSSSHVKEMDDVGIMIPSSSSAMKTMDSRSHQYQTRPPKRKSIDEDDFIIMPAPMRKKPGPKAKIRSSLPSTSSSSAAMIAPISSSEVVTGQQLLPAQDMDAVESSSSSSSSSQQTSSTFLIHARMILDLAANQKRTDKALDILRAADKSVRIKQARDILLARRSLDNILMDLLK